MAYDGVLDDFEACVALEAPSRMPVFALGLEFDLAQGGVTYGESRTDVEKTVRCTVEAVERYGYDWAVVFPDDYIEFEPLGLSMREDDALPAMPAQYLPMDSGTLGAFRIPDAQREMRMPIHLDMIRRLKAELGDTVCVMGRIAAPFSTLALIYGVETLLIAMIDDPELVRDNTRFFIDHQIAFGKAQKEAGADLLWLGDCLASSNFIRAEHFSAFAFEPAARVAAALSGTGVHLIYHTAETSMEHLKLETELPVSAVNVGEGVSIAEVKRVIGEKKCLMGNFDPMLLRDGGPEEISRATEDMIRENLRGGGYVFDTGEGVLTTTPPDNMAAMMRAARAMADEVADLM